MHARGTGPCCYWPCFLRCSAHISPGALPHPERACRSLRMLNFATAAGSIPASSSTHSRGFADMSLFVAKRLGLVAAVAIAVGACSPQSSAAPQAQTTAPVEQVPTAAPAVGTLNGRALPDFANLVEQVGPAVVNVGVVEKAHRNVRGQSSDDQEGEDPFQEFFKRFGIPA